MSRDAPAPVTTTEELRTKYPKIFSKPCEISIGPGWVPLVDRLCGMLQSYIDHNEHFDYGQITALQVKEKFAELRFYIDISQDKEKAKWTNWPEFARGAIDFATRMSRITCEECGHPGKVRITEHGYFYTSCEEHVKPEEHLDTDQAAG